MHGVIIYSGPGCESLTRQSLTEKNRNTDVQTDFDSAISAGQLLDRHANI